MRPYLLQKERKSCDLLGSGIESKDFIRSTLEVTFSYSFEVLSHKATFATSATLGISKALHFLVQHFSPLQVSLLPPCLIFLPFIALTSNFDRGLFHIVTKENSPEKLASLGLEGRAPSDRTCGSRAF